jgi:hypothetical protein
MLINSQLNKPLLTEKCKNQLIPNHNQLSTTPPLYKMSYSKNPAIHSGWRVLASVVVGGLCGVIIHAASQSTVKGTNQLVPLAQTVLVGIGISTAGALTFYGLGKLSLREQNQEDAFQVYDQSQVPGYSQEPVPPSNQIQGYPQTQPFSVMLELSPETTTVLEKLTSLDLKSALPNAASFNNSIESQVVPTPAPVPTSTPTIPLPAPVSSKESGTHNGILLPGTLPDNSSDDAWQ